MNVQVSWGVIEWEEMATCIVLVVLCMNWATILSMITTKRKFEDGLRVKMTVTKQQSAGNKTSMMDAKGCRETSH